MTPIAFAAALCLTLQTGSSANDAGLSKEAEDAALEALRGKPNRAREILGSGAEKKGDLATLVVLASMALDEGHLEEASRLAVLLRSLHPAAVDGKLLAALIAEREAHPNDGWSSAGLAAVKAVQPLGEGSPVFTNLWDSVWSRGCPLSEKFLRNLTVEEAFLARWAWPQPTAEKPDAGMLRDAMRLGTSSDRLLVQLVSHEILAQSQTSEVVSEAKKAYQGIHEKLMRDGVLSLTELENGDETSPVDAEEATVIEAAAAKARPPSFAGIYSELLRMLEKIDSAAAPGLALSGAVTFCNYSHPKLGRRLKLGLPMSASARQRLGRALVRVADLQQREGVLLTDLLATVSLAEASKLLQGDRGLKARAEAWQTLAVGRLNASRCVPPLLGLPIRSLHRAWAREVPTESRLFERARSMGLSCP